MDKKMTKVNKLEVIKFVEKTPLQSPFLLKKGDFEYFYNNKKKYLLSYGDAGYQDTYIIQIYTLHKKIKIDINNIINFINNKTSLNDKNVLLYSSDRINFKTNSLEPIDCFERFVYSKFYQQDLTPYKLTEEYPTLKDTYEKENMFFGYKMFKDNLFISQYQNKKLVALCGTHYLSSNKKIPSVGGLVWVSHLFRNKKYGTKIVEAMNSFLINTLSTNVVWDVSIKNKFSKQMMLNLGTKSTNETFNLYKLKKGVYFD